MTPESFASLPLPAALLDNLADLGFQTPTPIQAASLPGLLAGEDVIAQAKTGSGKTVAFGLTLLARLQPARFQVQALVLCPTRELAEQVSKEIRRLARCLPNIKLLTLCGGTPLAPQRDSLAHGAHIVVGTPGRVLDHLTKGSLSLEQVQTLVLDEADRMLDMGFADEMRHLLRITSYNVCYTKLLRVSRCPPWPSPMPAGWRRWKTPGLNVMATTELRHD